MIGRRTQPLFALLFLGGLVCLARLFQVQVAEHEVWAGEAARLVSFGRLLPYRRGAILDASGHVLARDKETHNLVLVYRDFRRGHPLGQVAHARSLLEGRAVPLEEAWHNLYLWTRELVLLSPAMLEGFADGDPLVSETLVVPAASEEERAGRPRRAADVRFYVRRLFDLSPREWLSVSRDLEPAQRERSFLALVAERQSGGQSPEAVWKAVEARLAGSEDHLERLARRLEWEEGPHAALGDAPGEAGGALAEGRTPVERLVHELEVSRRWVEDAAASKLFAEAAGFAPGRLAPGTLHAFLDLDWIRRLFVWDQARLDEWVLSSRASWLESWRDGYALPHLVASLLLERAPRPDDVLDHVCALFLPGDGLERALDGALPDWRELDELCVFDELERMFVTSEPELVRSFAAGTLRIQQPELRTLEVRPEVRWRLIDAALEHPPQEPVLGAGLRAALYPDERRSRSERTQVLGRALGELADDWEAAFQQRVAQALAALVEEAQPDELSAAGRLLFDEERRERAVERADYFLKDYGLRPRALVRGEPDYDVIYLLSRYEEFYPGFDVRDARERVYPVADGDSAPLAGKLLGHVSTISAFDQQSQRAELRRLRELRDSRRRSDEEELELVQLVGKVLQQDDVKGVSGLEGFLDPELVGRNGYFETRGLDDLTSDRRSFLSEPQNGEDVSLTLESALQRAAERTLREPQVVAGDEKYDYEWSSAPVGAIVLARLDGSLLAAASEPGEGSPGVEGASGQRGFVIDRTLRIPDFQPPGSVFKPFVAAYALERAGLDPEATVTCGPIERGGAGYKDIRCHYSLGHGPVNLRTALVVSCNAYFAWLGESLSTEDFRALARVFDFGQPTGVRLSPEEPGATGADRRRGGLYEEYKPLFEGELSEFQRRQAGNGLNVVEVNPVQMARATIGLATGSLPPMRLVGAIGGQPVPPRPALPVTLEPETLDFVRSALRGVTNEFNGTARNALSRTQLGFSVAAKTGSADIQSRRDDEERRIVRKHTWVTGWVPAEDPKAVFVIFMHDTQSTSSHGAVYLARQFLLQPEVLDWLDAQGVEGARR